MLSRPKRNRSTQIHIICRKCTDSRVRFRRVIVQILQYIIIALDRKYRRNSCARWKRHPDGCRDRRRTSYKIIFCRNIMLCSRQNSKARRMCGTWTTVKKWKKNCRPGSSHSFTCRTSGMETEERKRERERKRKSYLWDSLGSILCDSNIGCERKYLHTTEIGMWCACEILKAFHKFAYFSRARERNLGRWFTENRVSRLNCRLLL